MNYAGRCRLILLFWSCLFLFSACEKGHTPEVPWAERTLLVYMVADNSLGYSGFDSENLDMLLAAVAERDPSPGRVVVYRDASGSGPKLLEVVRNASGQGELRTLKEYESQNSLDPAIMRQVFSDVRS